jgi:serine/threonine-protein kinase RsbW
MHGAVLQTNSDYRSLPRIRDFVARACCVQARPPLAEEETYKLTVAVQEAATNVMRHAYHGSPEGKIRFESEVVDESITIRIVHWGEGFDPDCVGKPCFDEPREGGFGMYIISQYVDDVRYCSDGKGTHWVSLKKNRLIPASS